jgi:hypothetical protein
MAADAPLPAQGRWCDLEGTRIALFCRVEQVADSPEDGALFSRLHQRGEVVGRSLDLIYIRFDGEGQVIGLRPHLVRVLNAVSDGADSHLPTLDDPISGTCSPTENVRKGLDRS